MLRFPFRTLAWGLSALILGMVSGAVQAMPIMTLRVRPLRAAGGEGGVEHDLPTRLTTAMVKFLRDHAETTIRVETAERFEPTAAQEARTPYLLEGDLSYASGANTESGRYLLVARLIRQGRPNNLIGQWAGSAASLRYLTANLRNDSRVHTLGLVGEIGSRVLTALAADSARPEAQWRVLCAHLAPLRASEVTLVQPESPFATRTTITTGAAFRLRLQVVRGMSAYLITSGTDGNLTSEPLTLTANQGVSQILHLPKGTRDAWLLCSRANAAKGASIRAPQQTCAIDTGEDDAPVHILNGVGTGVSASQESATQLFAEIASDPAPWRVQRLRLATHK